MGAYDNLDASFSERLQAFINASGGLLGPGSGYRSEEEQAKLYQDYINGVPGQARAAKPGRSKHNHGLAMDLAGPDGKTLKWSRHPEAARWAHENAAKFGIYFPMADEEWHVQPIDGWNGQSSPGNKAAAKASFAQQLADAGLDPKDEVSSRMRSIMSLIVGDPSELMESDSMQDQLAATQDPLASVSPQYAGGADQKYALKRAQADADLAKWNSRQSPGAARNDVGPLMASGKGDMKRILETIKSLESGGDYGADNPNSSASGAYQFINSTWNGYKGYRSAGSAPAAVQDEYAMQKVQQYLNNVGGDVSLIPVIWYLGHVPKGSEWDKVPYGGNSLTPREYQRKWMDRFNSHG